MRILTFILKIAVLAGLLQVLLTDFAFGQDETPPAEHLVLISLDGFNPQWYQDAAWPMPFLQKKAREGAYARRARPPFPSTTRPGHVTLLTGWLPARHGVFNNSMPYRLEDGSSLFHAVDSDGGVTASVVWVGSHEAPIDHRVRNIDFTDFSDVSTVPPMEGLISPANNEGEGHTANYERYVTGIFRDAQLASIGVTFLERYRPNFLALRLNDTDTMQHRFGRDHAAVRGITASADMALAEVFAAAERSGIADQTVFIVTGDHGMEDIRTMLRPNIWLDNAGLGSEEGAHFEAYGGSAFLHGADEAQKEEILAMLNDLPEEDRESFSILSRSNLDEIGADPRATFALTAREGYAFDADWDGPARESTQRGSHGSLPTSEAPHNYTGFVVWGPGIEPGTVLDEVGLEDVAPTAAEFMGLELGDRDGRSLVRELRGEK